MELTNISAKLEFVQNEAFENNKNTAPPPEIINSPSAEIQEPTPDNPPWSSGIAFLVWGVSVLLILIFPTLIIGLYLAQAGINFQQTEQLQEFFNKDITVNILKVVSIIPAHILTLVLAWLVVTKFNKFSFRQTLGWSFNGFKVWYIFAITVFILMMAVMLVGYFGEQENELTIIVQSSRTAALLVAFIATFTAPIVEEVIYRGILYSAFQRSFGILTAVVLTTFLFGLVHIPQNINDYVAIGLIFLLSLILTLIRVWTKNLLPCIVLHLVFNGIQSVLIVLEPYVGKIQ